MAGEVSKSLTSMKQKRAGHRFATDAKAKTETAASKELIRHQNVGHGYGCLFRSCLEGGFTVGWFRLGWLRLGLGWVEGGFRLYFRGLIAVGLG